MSNNFLKTQVNTRPLSYEAPPFPSLYWPIPVYGPQSQYLWDATTIWRFTLLWTLIDVIGIHLLAAGYAMVIQWRNWKFIWITPIIFGLVGGIEAVIAGNVVGGLLGGVYTSGYFRMSTWIPFTWGLSIALILVLSSFAIQGGM
ncbi:hypothetical protein AMS68_005474 [Peltaster fructicola]|uniref:Integral membrane protein n=1 Tax=Peltaster fructicola TaxID=286661 RepID=A0A6H0XYY0_9PEZI|nr:hypothetical protein AMS68_005474 [Peltaster fructicola]